MLLEPHVLAWVTGIGVCLVLLHAAIAWWLRPLDGTAALHVLAVAFTLGAATVAVELDGAWLLHHPGTALGDGRRCRRKED